jgi:small-conductance mechanosensitive channel
MSRRGRGGTPISLFSFQDIITSVTGIMILVTLILALDVIRRREGAPDTQTAELTEELKQAAAQSGQVRTTLAATRQKIETIRSQLQGKESDLLEQVKYDSESLQRQLRDLDALNKLLADELADAESRRRAVETSRDELKKEDEARAADRQTLEQLTQQVQQKLEELRRLRSANRVIFNSGAGNVKSPWLVELSPNNIQAAEMGKRGAPQSFPNVAAFVAWAKTRSRSAEYFVLLVKPATLTDFYAAHGALDKAGYDLGFDLLKDDQTAIDSVLGAAAP